MASILVVEDTPANIELLRYLIAHAGHEALLSSSGEEGLQMLSDKQVDVVFVDIFMPGMDGFEFISRVRAEPDKYPARRFIAVTALAMDGDQQKILEAGFDGYMSKPIDAEDFLEALQSILNEVRCT